MREYDLQDVVLDIEVGDVVADTVDLASLFGIGVHDEPVVIQVSLKTPDELEVAVGSLVVAEVGSGLLLSSLVSWSKSLYAHLAIIMSTLTETVPSTPKMVYLPSSPPVKPLSETA